MSVRPDTEPEYQIALEEHRAAVERLRGAKALVVAAVLRRPRVGPHYARLAAARNTGRRPSLLDWLVARLIKADAQAEALAANDQLVAALRAHADACSRWLSYRESILMALEADPPNAASGGAAPRPGAHEEAA